MMKFVAPIVALLVAAPAWACNDPAHLRAVRDEARAAEAQAQSMKRQEILLKQQNKSLDQQRRSQR